MPDDGARACDEADIRERVRTTWSGNHLLVILEFAEGREREIAEDEYRREAVRRCCARRVL